MQSDKKKLISLWMRYLNGLPAPLPVFGVVGEPPHVHVGLDDLGAQDEVLLVLARGDGLDAAVKTKGFWSQLQSWRGGTMVRCRAAENQTHDIQSSSEEL